MHLQPLKSQSNTLHWAIPTNYNIHFNAIDSQSTRKDMLIKIKKTQYIDDDIILRLAELKYTGINNKNSISYNINNIAIIKNPKLIETLKECVLANPHS